jgi:hypothetical protein
MGRLTDPDVINICVQPLDKKDEIVANTIWRFLELRS